jgi:glutamate/tyrosine decarboxylase-like PLP-dependent enzyme
MTALAVTISYTYRAGGNLTVAFDAGLAHPVIVTVLGSTQEGRFEDVELLADATFKYLNQ